MHKVLLLFVTCALTAGCVRQSVVRPVSPPVEKPVPINVSDAVAPGVVAVIESTIVVQEPVSNTSLPSPFTLSGRAQVGTAAVQYTLRDQENRALADGEILLNGAPKDWVPFQSRIPFEQPKTPTGWLEVFRQTVPDKPVANLLRIPIRFSGYQEPVYNLYFSNSVSDPEVLFCNRVYPTPRTFVYSADPVRTVLQALFRGPTAAERAAGFFSSIPTTTIAIQSVEVASSTLHVDFSAELERGVGGSCRVAAIYAQLAETLGQFENVGNVIISIDGRTEDILQP